MPLTPPKEVHFVLIDASLEQIISSIVVKKGYAGDSSILLLRRNNLNLLLIVWQCVAMDYQCIVVYTIVRIAPLCSAQSTSTMCLSSSCLCTSELAAAASAADRREKGCLDWIKMQIKRFVGRREGFCGWSGLLVWRHNVLVNTSMSGWRSTLAKPVQSS